jgi:hypothetical protein
MNRTYDGQGPSTGVGRHALSSTTVTTGTCVTDSAIGIAPPCTASTHTSQVTSHHPRKTAGACARWRLVVCRLEERARSFTF